MGGVKFYTPPIFRGGRGQILPPSYTLNNNQCNTYNTSDKRSLIMSKLKLTVESIEALSDAQKAVLVRTGIISIEPTQPEEHLWQIIMVMLDRSYIANLLDLQLSTFNTYLADEYRLVKMKERLFIKLGTVISQRDITVVHNIYTKLSKHVEQQG